MISKKESAINIFRKICKLLQKVKFEFHDTLVYFSGLFPKFRSDYFGIIIFINEPAINLCATTNYINDMYFIDQKTLAFNDDLNQSLFLRRG